MESLLMTIATPLTTTRSCNLQYPLSLWPLEQRTLPGGLAGQENVLYHSSRTLLTLDRPQAFAPERQHASR